MRADIAIGADALTLIRLVQGYTPDPNRLPAFLLHLARDVEWDDEKPCFRTVASTLAQFYSLQEPLDTQHRQHSGTAVRRHSSLAKRKSSIASAAGLLAKGDSSAAAHTSPTAGAAGIDTQPAPSPHSNGSTVQSASESRGQQDAVEAALAAQRPHPNLSASEPVGDAVIAEAVDNMDEARLDDDLTALQPTPTAVMQDDGTEQPASRDGVVPTEAADVQAVSVTNGAASGGTDSLRAAASSFEAEDERAWTIQHVRRQLAVCKAVFHLRLCRNH